MKIVSVSDHAIVRYLELVKGFDLQAIRLEMATIVRTAVDLGAGCISHGRHTYHLDGAKLTTITTGGTPLGSRMKGEQHNGKSVRMQRDVPT